MPEAKPLDPIGYRGDSAMYGRPCNQAYVEERREEELWPKETTASRRKKSRNRKRMRPRARPRIRRRSSTQPAPDSTGPQSNGTTLTQRREGARERKEDPILCVLCSPPSLHEGSPAVLSTLRIEYLADRPQAVPGLAEGFH